MKRKKKTNTNYLTYLGEIMDSCSRYLFFDLTHRVYRFRNRIAYVNNAFLSIWGYDCKEDVIGEPISRFCGFKDRKRKIKESFRIKAAGRRDGCFS